MEKVLPSKEDFIIYEAVRSSGNWNMFEPNARKATGLSREAFLNVLTNYEALMEEYPDVREEE